MKIFFHKNDLPKDVDFANEIAIDTETMGLNIIRDRLCLVQISSGNGEAHLIHFEEKKYDAPNLKRLLSNDAILKIFHFARFDMAAISYYLGVEMNNIYCTKIASKLTRTYSDAHGLKAICEELLSIDLSKKQQSSDWGNKTISEKQQEYAACDVLYLHQLKSKLDQMLIRENRMDDFKKCLNFLPTRAKLDLLGFQSVDVFSH
jgi:ribonuclease D